MHHMTDERIAITTVTELNMLNGDDVLEGYCDGFDGDKEPGDNRSKSYWHGWRNGALDGGHIKKDQAHKDLAAAWLALNDR
jgi:hypothetical protein